MPIKSFKGQLGDLEQDQIRLRGGDPMVGWKIRKFQIMGRLPAGENQESVVKIYQTEQDPPFQTSVNFREDALLAVAYLEAAADAKTESQPQIVVFDNIVFNQDIWISHADSESGGDINYYIELEEVKMTGAEAAVVNFNAGILFS